MEFTQVNSDPGVSFRSMVYVDSKYHSFEEEALTDKWKIRKRTSSDGLHFSTLSKPLFEPGEIDEFDNKGQADPTVIYDDRWRMWFDALDCNAVWSKLGYATSNNGEDWEKHGPVLSRGNEGEWDCAFIHHPVCVKHEDKFYLFYAGSRFRGHSFNIGLATSKDGIKWVKEPSNPIISTGNKNEWDGYYIRPSRPVYFNGTWFMWYWGCNEITHATGLATSKDLIHWTKQGKKITNEDEPITATDLMMKDSVMKMWYSAHPSANMFYLIIGLNLLLDFI